MTVADAVESARLVRKACPTCGEAFDADAGFCPFDGIPLVLRMSLDETAALEAPPSASARSARAASARADGNGVADAGVGVEHERNPDSERRGDGRGAEHDARIGMIVDGRYEILQRLGAGGMGIVYKVRHVTIDKLFAMKVLRGELARDAALAARFLREARATAGIAHPHVVAITDFGEVDEGVPYFVMELLVGETLADRVHARGPLPVCEAAAIARNIAEALAAAHRAFVVHRDLKPENVFLVGAATGKTKFDLRVVDFGAAKSRDPNTDTGPGLVLGTPYYMSPEQASGGDVDARTDIYALGIVLYEMVTGQVPFDGDAFMEVLGKHVAVRPTEPSALAPPGEDPVALAQLDGIVMRALEKSKEARQQTMSELSSELATIAEYPTSVRQPTARLAVPYEPRHDAARFQNGARGHVRAESDDVFDGMHMSPMRGGDAQPQDRADSVSTSDSEVLRRALPRRITTRTLVGAAAACVSLMATAVMVWIAFGDDPRTTSNATNGVGETSAPAGGANVGAGHTGESVFITGATSTSAVDASDLQTPTLQNAPPAGPSIDLASSSGATSVAEGAAAQPAEEGVGSAAEARPGTTSGGVSDDAARSPSSAMRPSRARAPSASEPATQSGRSTPAGNARGRFEPQLADEFKDPWQR